MRSFLTTFVLLLMCCRIPAQVASADVVGQYMMSEDVGLAMNRAQVMVAAEEAWQYSFGQEPGSSLLRIDTENGLIEGTARVNYRSTMLIAREESMGPVSYQVTIQAKNGQCHVRVHNLRHTGNRGAQGGGINVGLILEGTAPDKHYPGIGLSLSRRLHADVRKVVSIRIEEVMRAFASRLRLLGEQ